MSNDKGQFLTILALRATYPVGKPGWFATIGEIVYAWNHTDQIWESRAGDALTLGGELPSYYLDEGNHTRTYVSVSIDTTLTSSNRMVEVDCTLGPVEITLPTAVGFSGMFDVTKIDSSANAVTVTPQPAQTISGEVSQEIFGEYDSMTLVSNGTNWIII